MPDPTDTQFSADEAATKPDPRPAEVPFDPTIAQPVVPDQDEDEVPPTIPSGPPDEPEA